MLVFDKPRRSRSNHLDFDDNAAHSAWLLPVLHCFITKSILDTFLVAARLHLESPRRSESLH